MNHVLYCCSKNLSGSRRFLNIIWLGPVKTYLRGRISPPIPFSPTPSPPPPTQKKSFGFYTVLPRNLQNLFIPPENEHTSAKLIVNVYLKKPKTTFSSDDASGSRDFRNPMCYFYRLSIYIAFKKPPNLLICTEYHLGLDICQSL